MNIVKYAVVGLAALMLGVGIGISNDTDAAVNEEVGAIATPDITPPSVPTPEPTPITVTETVEVEVEVVPYVCREALWAADAVIGDTALFTIEVLEAYVDYPDEDLLQFGRRVEDIISSADVEEGERLWTDYQNKADRCHAY